MEFKEIAEKVKRAKRVRIWIGDPDQPAVGKWITPTKEMIENLEDNQRRIREALGLIKGDIITIGIRKHTEEGMMNWMAFTTPLGRHGIITIPKTIREALQLKKGDLVDLEVRKASRRPPY